jgi:hypothetical protein
MRYLPLLCVLFVAFSGAQETPRPSDVSPDHQPAQSRENDEKETPMPAAKVAPDAAVITIKGLCAQSLPTSSGSSDSGCTTIITRGQFEKLTEALQTNMRPSRQRQLAHAYPGLLVMAREAEARGIENNPRFQERMQFARVQILSQELIRQIEHDSMNVSDQDIEKYYKNHADLFNTATLERIFVPLGKRADLAAVSQPSEPMVKVAENLRARAIAGEPFIKLEQEAYQAAGMTEVPPNPSLGQVKQSGLPAAQAAVFELNPGEVSQVLSTSAGLYIYKMDSKQKPSLDAVKDEIRKTIQNQQREQAINAIQESINPQFNSAYFGPGDKSSTPADAPDSK